VNTTAGVIETVGNAAAVYAATLWAVKAWPGVRRATLVLAGIAVWAATNVFYGVAYVGRTTGRFELWDTTVEDVVLTVQQATMVWTPLAAIWLLGPMLKDRWNAVRPS